MQLKLTRSLTLRKMPFIILAAFFVALLLFPSILRMYYVYFLSLVFVNILLAMSVNIILGYGGMLPMHQAVFFGVGAYSIALLLNKSSLPSLVSFLLAPLIVALFAFIIGGIAIRLRGLYFGVMTLALGQVVWAIIYRWYAFTGGDDGIPRIAIPEALRSLSVAYYIALITAVACIIIIYFIINSPFGRVLQAIRDNPQRSESIGVNIRLHRLIAFVIAGFFSGIAGVLYSIVDSSVSPSLLFWDKSAELLIMVLLGGMHTFLGPVVGAFLVVSLYTFLGIVTEYWLLFLGGTMIIILLFLPQGILGFIVQKLGRKKY